MSEQDFPISGDAQVPIPPKRTRTLVTIATPLRHYRDERDLPPQIGRTLRELIARSAEHDYEFEFMAVCGGLCSARNRGVHEFLKTDAQWFLPWDADLHDQHGKEADAILRLLSRKVPIVGGLYCRRESRARWVGNWINGAKVQEDGLLQMAELGGGFKLHHRKVFEELRRIFGDVPLKDGTGGARSIYYNERETGERIAGFYQIVVNESDLLSEDYFLDWLCRCAQIPIMADVGVRLKQVETDRDGKVHVYPEVCWPPIPAEETP